VHLREWSSRAVAVFLLRFGFVYALLAIPWPGARDAAATWFHHTGEAIARIALRDAVHFGRSADPASPSDTEVTIRKPAGTVVHIRLESRTLSYLPAAFFTALVLATPWSWRRRAASWLIGMALLGVFTAIRVAIPLTLALSDPPRPWWNVAPALRTLLVAAEPILARRSATGFAAAVFVWVGLVALAGPTPGGWLSTRSSPARRRSLRRA